MTFTPPLDTWSPQARRARAGGCGRRRASSEQAACRVVAAAATAAPNRACPFGFDRQHMFSTTSPFPIHVQRSSVCFPNPFPLINTCATSTRLEDSCTLLPHSRPRHSCVACCVSPLHPWTPRLVAAPDHVFALPTSFKVISHPCGTLPRPAPAPSLKWLLQLQSSSSWKTTGATAASTMCFRLLKSIISCAANGHSRA